jgi:catechol 2,3-dioxygenase-like lactoylglutathione lyase family enzyme
VHIERVRLLAPAQKLSELERFYAETLGIERAGKARFSIGESELELVPSNAEPFYHFALLVPANRFASALEWVGARAELLPSRDTGDVVFTFEDWDAFACYFEDPAGNIVELVAHTAIGANGARGEFGAGELLGFSELGVVGDKRAIARELERLDLHMWTGTLDHPERLAFVGEKGRTLILSDEGRGWMPTERPAAAHAVDVVISGRPRGEVAVGRHRVRRSG